MAEVFTRDLYQDGGREDGVLLSVKCMVCPFSFSFPWLVDLHLMARSMIIVTAVSAPFTSLQLPLPLTQTPSSDPLHFRSIQQHLCLLAAYALLPLFHHSLKNYSKATAETCSAIIHRKCASRNDMIPLALACSDSVILMQCNALD